MVLTRLLFFQGTAIRLGGVQWGSDMRGETHFQQTLERKDAELCLSYADMLEVGAMLYFEPPITPFDRKTHTS